MIIREMSPSEIDSVVNLFEYYRQDAGITDEKYSENRVIATVREYAIRTQLFLRVAYNGQRPVGLIGGFLSQDPVDTDLIATIQFCYLLPEFNDISNYSLLIKEFTTWAEQCKATAVRAIDIGENLSRLQDIYDELGFNIIRVAIMNKEIA